jgi:hypothetical protein
LKNRYHAICFNSIEKNNYLVDDGVRDTDFLFRQKIENKLLSIYEEFKIKIIDA